MLYFNKTNFNTFRGCIEVKDGHRIYTEKESRTHKIRIVNANDGFIFTPDEEPFLAPPGTLLKWKPLEENTVDFLVRPPYFDQEGNLELHTWVGDNKHVLARRAFLPISVRSDFESLMRHAGTWNQTCIVECRFVPGAGSWYPVAIRPDKNTANFVSTVVSTLEVIASNIRENDLEEIAPG
eukprot:GABV01000661.1.p2 GENE.GABV01000661.1~~GABV01000661.1.p2  ORF type:complete len:181 (-),score=38.88 GABV01000661.1:307-849(-)